MKKLELLIPIKSTHVGCLCCSSAGNFLPMETELYQGFGGYRVEKNGKLFYMANCNSDNNKTLSDIEQIAAITPNAYWRVIAFMPLHGETYQRQKGEWLLVEQNMGFA